MTLTEPGADGAVNNPLEVIVPALVDHTTPELKLLVPVTVALHCEGALVTTVNAVHDACTEVIDAGVVYTSVPALTLSAVIAVTGKVMTCVPPELSGTVMVTCPSTITGVIGVVCAEELEENAAKSASRVTAIKCFKGASINVAVLQGYRSAVRLQRVRNPHTSYEAGYKSYAKPF